MSQLSFYIPDALEAQLRLVATQRKQSISALVTELVRREIAPKEWPDELGEAFGALSDDFDEPADPPPQVRDTSL